MSLPIPRTGGTTPEAFVDALLDWMSEAGARRYDEVVTQAEHACQCASLAREDAVDEATIAAALLHDVGHLLMLEYQDSREPRPCLTCSHRRAPTATTR